MPKFYWKARGDASQIKPGFKVPAAKPRITPVEAIFEQVRKEQFPSLPSRLNCKFVCPELKGWCSLGRNDWDTGEPEYVFEVQVTGKTLTTNADLFSKAREDHARFPHHTAEIAEDYWNPRGSILFPETLVDGTVTVVRRIQPPEESRTSSMLKGYKSVALVGGKYRSLYDNSPIPGKMRSVHSPPGGLYLGTTEQFVRDYYTGMTDEDEIILVYEYAPRDVISGNPNDSEGEVKVRKARLVGTVKVASHTRVAARYRRAVTNPLPDNIPQSEIGLMTKKEFLDFRNEGGKFHPSDSYDFDYEKINWRSKPSYEYEVTDWNTGRKYQIWKGDKGYFIRDEDGRLAAVIHNGTLYHDRKNQSTRDIPTGYRDTRYHEKEYTDLGVKRYKLVKYLSEYMPLVHNEAAINRRYYDNMIQRIKVGDEYMEVRTHGPPEIDKLTSMAILNEDGMVVAKGQNEWGATLLVVAEEYRRRGLGKIIAKYWYKYNPNSVSGGFTSSGQANAIRTWESRVRQLLSWGWYSEMLKRGWIDKDQIKEILAGLSERVVFKEEKPQPKQKPGKKQVLVYYDDPTVIVYDARFLDDPHAEDSDKYIHGYGFLRDNPHQGVYLYRLDYDRPYHKLTTYAALQMARDSGDKLYNGEGYSDLLELGGLDNIAQEGDYIWLTKDMIPLKQMGKLEKLMRKKNDPYGETTTLLLEGADAKWR